MMINLALIIRTRFKRILELSKKGALRLLAEARVTHRQCGVQFSQPISLILRNASVSTVAALLRITTSSALLARVLDTCTGGYQLHQIGLHCDILVLSCTALSGSGSE